MTFRNVLMLSALAAPGAAFAQETPFPFTDDGYFDDDEFDNREQFGLIVRGNEDHLISDMGVALMVGGGAMNRMTARDANPTTPGGTWLARGVIGTRSFVAGELAYVGSATPIQGGDATANGNDDAMLMSNGGEVALRGQIPVPLGVREMVMVAPFVTAGLGLQVHDLVNSGVEISNDGQIGDDLTLHLPVGAGLAVAAGGFIADARVSYRPAIANDNQVFGAPTRFDNALDELAVTGSIGVEF